MTVFFKARDYTFKKNVEVGRKLQELSFFVGEGLYRSDLIVYWYILAKFHHCICIEVNDKHRVYPSTVMAQ